MNQYVVVTMGKHDEWEEGRYYDLDVAKEAARDCERLANKGDKVELRQYVDEKELDYNTFDFAAAPEEQTYIINERRQAGGKSYKTYTWPEVLAWFSAPSDIDDIVDLEAWIEEQEGHCDYIIEEF